MPPIVSIMLLKYVIMPATRAVLFTQQIMYLLPEISDNVAKG